MRSSSFLEASAFFRSQHQPDKHKFPYLQLHLFTSHFGNGALTYEKAQKNFNLKGKASVFKIEKSFLRKNIVAVLFSRSSQCTFPSSKYKTSTS